jgi:hypothetical protein
MPIRRYLKKSAVFMPEAISAMSQGLTDTAEILGSGYDETSVKPSRDLLSGWPAKTAGSMPRTYVIGR